MHRTLMWTSLAVAGTMACQSTATDPSRSALVAAPAPYETIDLGTLGGVRSSAVGLNDVGQVVGWSQDSSGARRAFLWQDGVMRDLGSLGDSSYATDVNQQGQVTGVILTADGQNHAFLWSDGVMQDLDPDGQAPLWCGCNLPRINNAGHVIWTGTTPEGLGHAFLWRDGVATDLGAIGGVGSSSAAALNDEDEVVGSSNRHAFLWDQGTMQDLGWLGASTGASDINNAGQVVGTGNTITLHRHAVMWDQGQMIDLGTLSGDNESNGVGINSLGQVVGNSWRMSVFEVWHPFVSLRGTLLPLSPTYQTDPVLQALAINDRGQIVGNGLNGRPWVWEGGVMWGLAGLGDWGTSATAVNARGDVVGWSYTTAPITELTDHAVLWRRTPAVAGLPSPH